MTMLRLHRLSFTFLLILVASGWPSFAFGSRKSSSLQDNVMAKPTRSECIVKVVSKDPMTTKFSSGGLALLIPVAFRNKIPLAGYSVASNKIVYLQFSKDCNQRYGASKYLFMEIGMYASVEVSVEFVVAGPKTIDMKGGYWRD